MSDKPDENFKSIYNQAIRYLSYREHTIEELRTKLLKKFIVAQDIDQVIEQLLLNDLLSEQRFTESYIRMRVNKGYGPAHIRNELMGKGISGSVVEEALKDCQTEWQHEIYKVWVKKFDVSRFSQTKRDKARQWRFLQYRGFSHEQIKSLFSRIEMNRPE